MLRHTVAIWVVVCPVNCDRSLPSFVTSRLPSFLNTSRNNPDGSSWFFDGTALGFRLSCVSRRGRSPLPVNLSPDTSKSCKQRASKGGKYDPSQHPGPRF